jgi:hypothetical protein
MPELPNWRSFAVRQRRPATGCIPTGYEMLVRAAGLKDIDLTSFQDEFDLDKNPRPGDLPKNNFESVASAVQAKYPHVRFRRQAFGPGQGADKLAFVESCLATLMPGQRAIVDSTPSRPKRRDRDGARGRLRATQDPCAEPEGGRLADLFPEHEGKAIPRVQSVG